MKAWATAYGEENARTYRSPPAPHAWEPSDVAEAYAEERYAGAGYPDEQDISVRDDAGNVTRWIVLTAREPTFHAQEQP